MTDTIKTADDCIHCHICRDNCDFLGKYGIDIGDADRLRELAHHCFLCGECTRVCPVGIDGRAEVINLRRDIAATEEGYSNICSTYKGTIAEKNNYSFRNYKPAAEGAAYFPGCNFPSLYPKTSDYISKTLKERFGIGTVYDCCGKPIGELGLEDNEAKIIEDMNERLRQRGITELITACPNCKDYLSRSLNIPVVDIYTKLRELGLGSSIAGDRTFYIPCPDRTDRSWLEAITHYIEGDVTALEGIQCCGLGGMARIEEPELARAFADKLSDRAGDSDTEIHTYCASCVGNYVRNGRPVNHILTEIMGTDEVPDTRFSYINRMKTKYKR